MKINIKTAESAGFCFGVDRAVKIVYNIIGDGLKPVMLGDIIHNADVMADLTRQGGLVIEPDTLTYADLTEYFSDNRHKAVIRSHGVGRAVYALLDCHNIPYADGTCPCVKKIQNIASEKSLAGYTVIIMGDKKHPEIEGISNHCLNMPLIFADTADLKGYFKKNYTNLKKKVAILAQTTYNISIWEECVRIVSEMLPEAEVFDTVCRATCDRQNEAILLAESSALMVVIGGKNSSNSVKLYELCKEKTHSIFISSAAELNESVIKTFLRGTNDGHHNIGITAGASVPAYIIKEVQNKMSELLQNFSDEDFNFEEALDASFKRIYTGNRVKGYITAVNSAEAVVDVGTKHTGYVTLDELTDDPSLKPSDIVKVGEEVELIVIKINDAEGIVQLSKKKVDAAAGFNTVKQAAEDGAVLDGIVKEIIKGGLIVLSHGMKIFVPASLSGVARDESLEKLLKKNVSFKVVEFNEQRGKAVGSIKAVLGAQREAAKAKFWETAEVGAVYKGEVKSLTNYGAFVDLGGIDGMVHASELSWKRIKHASEILAVGDVVEVYIKELSRERNRVSLGYKKTEDNPWVKFADEYSVGDTVKVKIVSVMPFGAFAQVIPGIDGLIHISQLSDKKLANVKDAVNIGDETDAKIIEIDLEKKRVSLSIRELLEETGNAEDYSAPIGIEEITPPNADDIEDAAKPAPNAIEEIKLPTAGEIEAAEVSPAVKSDIEEIALPKLSD
ncbi:MAG: bifunctional 4-hydroxy-3-methylbut-2-enyl diphosphate reductase/30S ribosomal protein S1 [Oscillospiraceae bacterium]|nr:bifunctional 4-hydroxy-3-methylbut-2-enyl diphosphate reductase/30S ribosomal protein S1 [Oscillospiraceae bacterium]